MSKYSLFGCVHEEVGVDVNAVRNMVVVIEDVPLVNVERVVRVTGRKLLWEGVFRQEYPEKGS